MLDKFVYNLATFIIEAEYQTSISYTVHWATTQN